MLKKILKNCKVHKKSENFGTPYENLEKYGSFSKFRTSTEMSAMLATLYEYVGEGYSCLYTKFCVIFLVCQK